MARRLSAEDALRPGANPSVEDLYRLINGINPTEASLMHHREKDRRYVIKARLQSLLLRRFPDVVTIEDDGEGTVVLMHIDGDRDFCHAVVDDLDEDVRALVDLWLDEDEHE
jgi:hypothetical protein